MNRTIQWQFSILTFVPILLYFLFTLNADFEKFMPSLLLLMLGCALLLLKNLDWRKREDRIAWFASVFLSTFPYILLASKISDNYNFISFFYFHLAVIGLFFYPIRKTNLFVPGVFLAIFGPIILWGVMEVLKETKLSVYMVDHMLVQSYNALEISMPNIFFTGVFAGFLFALNMLLKRKLI